MPCQENVKVLYSPDGDPLMGTQGVKCTFWLKKVTLVTSLHEHIFDSMDFWVIDG